jgi:hypothetical protein
MKDRNNYIDKYNSAYLNDVVSWKYLNIVDLLIYLINFYINTCV